MSGRIVFIDIESGGLDPEKHAIIQIAAIAVSDDLQEELGTFERKILFRQDSATAEALEINSYDPEIWAREAVPPKVAEVGLSSFLRTHATVQKVSKKGKAYQIARLAGHNAATFDVPFLRAWYERLGAFSPFSWLCLDTLQLALWILGGRVQSFKLGDLCEYYGIELYGAHGATADVRATLELARMLRLRLEGERVTWKEVERTTQDLGGPPPEPSTQDSLLDEKLLREEPAGADPDGDGFRGDGG